MASSPPSERRLLGAVGAVRRDEWPLALLMFAYFFLVITTFWILKPIKKALFIEYYDERRVHARLVAALERVAGRAAREGAEHGRRGRRRRRVHLARAPLPAPAALPYVFCAFFVAGYLAYCAGDRGCPGGGDRLVVLPVRRSLQHADGRDVLRVPERQRHARRRQAPVRPRRPRRRARRRLRRASSVRAFIDALEHAEWLWVCAGIAGVIIVAVACAARARLVAPPAGEPRVEREAAPRGNPALEGARARLRARPTCCRSPPSSASTRSSRRSWTSSSPHRGALPRGRGDRRALRDGVRHHQRRRRCSCSSS